MVSSALTDKVKEPPIVVHVIHRFGIGGLETVLVEMLNDPGARRYRHVIITLTNSTEFERRLTNKDVSIYALNKRPGQDFRAWSRAWGLFRRLKPTIVQTYNIAALEYSVIARLAGVTSIVHVEHGRVALDPQGMNKKYNMLRRVISFFVNRWISVSNDLHRWSQDVIRIPKCKSKLIYNGVNTTCFSPMIEAGMRGKTLVIGTVGRLDPVKNQALLLRAFREIRGDGFKVQENVVLWIIGDGPLRKELETLAHTLGIAQCVRFLGARDDIVALLRKIDIFVLPSIAEGMPMTLLEAMATGVPAIATKVGGIPEVLRHEHTGLLLEKNDENTLARMLEDYINAPSKRKIHGQAARACIEERFSLKKMVDEYISLYDALVNNEASSTRM